MLPFLLLLFLSSAGGSRPARTAPIPAPVTACQVVTRAEVIEAVGRTVGSASEATGGTESSCDFATQHGLVTVVIERVAAPADLRREIEAIRKMVPEGSVRSAGSISPRAFFFDIPGAGTQLHILREHECLLISVLGFGEPEAVTAAAESIARKALSRL